MIRRMAHQSTQNKNMQANACNAEGALVCNTPLAATPIGYVRVFVDTFAVPIGDGDKSGWGYWSSDDGETALTFSVLDNTAKLYWSPTNAGRQLGGWERVEFDFLEAD
jgi:hypothetical protein